MKIIGIHHIELTVSSLENSKAFYSKLHGFTLVAEYPDFIMFNNGRFYLGLTTHDGNSTGPYSETHIGMDHVSFEVESEDDLHAAVTFFDNEGIPHGEIKKLSNNVRVLAFRDPDNIQLELAYSPQQ